MEPDKQYEIQLGHMCNNRCVFCVSGQRTANRDAFPLEAEPLLERIREGYASGLRKVTFLGGEPTLQPEFMTCVREAVRLGYDEVVIFTNGAKTARGEFIDEVLATGGRFAWRLSFQGGNALAHERTTKKLGSFGRLRQTLIHLKERGQKVSVNMCVVKSNYASVADFPKLLEPYGVWQVHLDMMRPRDAGVRTDDELRDSIPRYSDMVPALEAMVAGFSEGVDVNVGNLPFCIAPQLAPWIHHDGNATLTVAIDEHDRLSEAWDKYEVKARDKVKRDACGACAFDARCAGVYEKYTEFYGMDEFVPVSRERLLQIDTARRLFTLHTAPFVDALRGCTLPAPFTRASFVEHDREHEWVISLEGDRGEALELALRRPSEGGVAATDLFALQVIRCNQGGPEALAALRALFARMTSAARCSVVHPVADDALGGASLDPKIYACLSRLRARAPFGALRWREVRVGEGGRDATMGFEDAAGGVVEVSVAVAQSAVRGSYRLGAPEPAKTPELIAGVRAVMDALRTPV
ncbi:MAG: radical SAM protein [Polyangiales bacterium]